MKKLLTIFAVSVIAMSLSVASFAQDAGPKGGAPGLGGKAGRTGQVGKLGKIHDEILAKLNLTQAQKDKIAALKKELQSKVSELRKSGDKDAAKGKLRELMQEHSKAVMNVLTPAQKEQYAKLLKEYREKIGKGKGKGDIPPRA